MDIDLLGLKINLGNTKGLQEMGDKLKETGAFELLSDRQWRSGLSSIRTGRDIRHIPDSSGFARSTPSPRRNTSAKAKETSYSFKIERDIDLEKEMSDKKKEIND